MSKFCPQCGQTLPDMSVFCINCGVRQPEIERQPHVETAESEESKPTSESIAEPDSMKADSESEQDSAGADIQGKLSRPANGNTAKDLGLSFLTKGVMDVGPLMKEQKIIDEKIRLGYSADPNNFVYTCTPLEWKNMLTVGALTGMASQNYILCFEEHGILLLGSIGLAKFNGDNHFISNETVQKIDLEKAFLNQEWDHMYLQISGETLELLVQHPTFSVIKWHRRNFKINLNYTK